VTPVPGVKSHTSDLDARGAPSVPFRPIAHHGRALMTLLRAAWREYERDYAKYFAGAMVYYAIVSIVPLLLLVLATLGLLLRFSAAASAAEQRILQAVEGNLGAEMTVALEGLLNRLQDGSIIAIVVSVVGLLITASAFFRHLRLTFRALWKHQPPMVSGSVRGAVRETLLEQAMGLLMVLTAGALLIVTLALIAIVHWLSGLFSELPRFSDTIGWLIALPIPLVLATVTFALLFRFLPPVPLAWRHVWLAAVLCAVAWIIGADLLALYASFGDNSAYGAIGGLFVVMVWMKFVSVVLFYGAEVCKVVATTSAHT
jgi:membrane protein